MAGIIEISNICNHFPGIFEVEMVLNLPYLVSYDPKHLESGSKHVKIIVTQILGIESQLFETKYVWWWLKKIAILVLCSRDIKKHSDLDHH